MKRLYEMWKSAGQGALRDWLERTVSIVPERSVTFSSFLIDHDYSFIRQFDADEIA